MTMEATFTLRMPHPISFGYYGRSCTSCPYEWFGDTDVLEPYEHCPYCGSGYTEHFHFRLPDLQEVV